MKYIICLGDGMADEPISSLGEKTPLEAANIPNMDALAKSGELGLVNTSPEGYYPGSDVTNMGILGYDPREFYTGRGPIEAASMNIEVPEGLMVFRCNLVNIENDTMVDFTSGHISTEESHQLMAELNEKMGATNLIYHPGVSYRHILLASNRFAKVGTTAPHDIIDQGVKPYLPNGDHQDGILDLMGQARAILKQSPVNQKRLAEGKKPATDIWPWSQGLMPSYPSFESRTGLTGGIVTAVDLLKGLAVLTDLEAPEVPGATGFIDTDYEAKMAAALSILDQHDFVYIHVEAPDECGHMGDAKLKTEAIEAFDEKIVGPVRAYQAKNPDTRVLVLPDHPTPCAIKTHTDKPVPYILNGPGVSKAHQEDGYSEAKGENTGVHFDFPWELLNALLKKG